MASQDGRAGIARWVMSAALMVLAACASKPGNIADHAVRIDLRNAGAEPLRCQLIFGHWVERGLGEIAPGAAIRLDLMRAAEDGGLYVMRYDGQRRMMVENVICGGLENWRESLGQVDLGELRRRPVVAAEASCAAPDGPGRVACRMDRASE